MKRISYWLLAFQLCATFATAQSSVWEVSKDSQKLYLGGTCHLLRTSDYPLPAEFDKAYSKADRLVFEVDPAIFQEPSFAMRLMSEGSYQDGRTLKTVLSKEAYSALAEQGRKSNLPIEVIQRTKPGMAVMMLTIQELTKVGVTQEGVDVHYANRAHSDKKPVDSLETAEFQLNLITNLGEGIDSEFVLYSLKDLNKVGDYFDQIINAWRDGDIQSINNIFVEDMTEFPEIYDLILKDRNANWLPQIEAMLRTEPTEFVLVGVGHMAGEDGLIALLKAKGYTVTQTISK